MPVRKSRYDPRIGNINGWFPSKKMKRAVPFESYLEYCCFIILEFLLVVSIYEVQPFSTHYRHPDTKRKRKYTPDVEAIIIGEPIPVVIDIKPAGLVDLEKYAPIASHVASDLNKRFVFITDEALHKKNVFSNVFDLHYHARYEISPIVQEAYQSVLSGKNLTIGQLAYQILPIHPEKALTSILRLMWDRKIGCDIQSEQLFTTNTVIWLANEADELERDAHVFAQICST